MSNISKILDISRRALVAQQAALNVTSNNIANVNTPGYSRQRIILEPNSTSHQVSSLQTQKFLGAGVSVLTVERTRSTFISSEIRSEKQEMKRWQHREQYFLEIESIYNEPSDSGLSSVIQDFWDAWDELSNDPQSWSARERLKQGGISLSNTINYMNKRFVDLQMNLDEELVMRVEEVNSLLDQIGGMNLRIASSVARNIEPNELKDQRDMLIENLSELIDVQIVEHPSGSVTVSLSGRTLVERDSVYKLGVKERSLGYGIVHDVVWGSDQDITINNGMLKGILEVRDDVIVNELEHLDTLASALVTSVNSIHQGGYALDGTTDHVFFDPDTTGARDMAVDATILADLNNIAASGDGSPGDASTALEIANLRESRVLQSGTSTIEDYYASAIASIGVRSREATFMRENQELIVEQLENQRSSISGVSLDEEMMNLVKYQHAYEAAAHLISTIDEMMQTIIDIV